MNRTEFEVLRDLPGKTINADIQFVNRRANAPLLVAEDVVVENASGEDARLNITYNPEVGSVSFNVHILGVGPICRLAARGKSPARRRAADLARDRGGETTSIE